MRVAARHRFVPGGIVAAVASGYALAGGKLALFSFGIVPKWLGIPPGLLDSRVR